MEFARRDWSTVSLLGANLLTMGVALWEQWEAAWVLWTYWGQSLIIGVFSFLRILKLQRFTTAGLKINRKPVPPTPQAKRQAAFFFLSHYSVFHVSYAAFLLAQAPLRRGDVWPLLVCQAAFLANHAFSFRYNLEADRARTRSLAGVMLLPYARILPMHLTILIGFGWMQQTGFSTELLLLFLGLKTAADLLAHVAEHAGKRAGSSGS